MEKEEKKNNVKEYFQVGEVFSYFIRVFKKGDGVGKRNFNLRMMHGINRISILLFLVAFILWLLRRLM